MNFILLNQQSFVQNINSRKIHLSDELFFKVEHESVRKDLIHTNMISDLYNIIMTYVNDEIIVNYEIISSQISGGISIYYTLNCDIWLAKYEFCYVDYVQDFEYPLKSIMYLSENNNMINHVSQISRYVHDYKYRIYCNNIGFMLHTFVNYYDKSFSNKKNDIYIRQIGLNTCIIKQGSFVEFTIYDKCKLNHIINMIKLIHNAGNIKPVHNLNKN